MKHDIWVGVFTCAFATLLLPFAECCSMAKLVAFIALGEKVLWCIACCFVPELVNEEAIPDAVVGTYRIMGEHYDGAPKWLQPALK